MVHHRPGRARHTYRTHGAHSAIEEHGPPNHHEAGAPRPQGWGDDDTDGCLVDRRVEPVPPCGGAAGEHRSRAGVQQGSDPTSAWRWLIHAHLVNARQEDTPLPARPVADRRLGDSVSEQLLPGRELVLTCQQPIECTVVHRPTIAR